MPQGKRVTKHYPGAAEEMRQDLRTMHEHYRTHEQKFQQFNPESDADYAAEWLKALDDADAATSHAARVGELKEHTGAVNGVMEQAQAALQTLFYYVGRAFPGNAGRLDQYGRRTYAAARDSQDKMRALLSTAHAAATRDHAALAAKGYTAAQVEALGQLGEQLTAANTTQEVKKGTNTEDTDHYLTLQNLAYGYGQEVSAAAKVLFAGDAAARALFRLGDGSSPGKPAPTGPVKPQA